MSNNLLDYQSMTIFKIQKGLSCSYGEMPAADQLQDYIYLALDIYLEDVGEGADCERIKHIRETCAEDLTDKQKIYNIKACLNGAGRLNKYCKQAIEQFNNHHNRLIRTIRWDAAPNAKPSKVLLVVHGMRCSGMTYDDFCQAAAKQGYTVFSYDQREHNFAAPRGGAAPTEFELRLDFRAMLIMLEKVYPQAQVAVVGHSMGGSLLTVENAYLNKKEHVKHRTLVAPALMSGFSKYIKPNRYLGTATPDLKVLKRAHKTHRAPTFSQRLWAYKKDLKLMFTTLMRLQRKAFKALSRQVEIAGGVPTHHIIGGEDRAVGSKDSEMIRCKVNDDSAVTFTVCDGDHMLLNGSNAVEDEVFSRILSEINIHCDNAQATFQTTVPTA